MTAPLTPLRTVSLDYLIKQREVLTEVYRCIRPGGIVAFSNRCFATKAVAMWLKAMDEGGEAMQTAVATLLRFGGGGGHQRLRDHRHGWRSGRRRQPDDVVQAVRDIARLFHENRLVLETTPSSTCAK